MNKLNQTGNRLAVKAWQFIDDQPREICTAFFSTRRAATTALPGQFQEVTQIRRSNIRVALQNLWHKSPAAKGKKRPAARGQRRRSLAAPTWRGTINIHGTSGGEGYAADGHTPRCRLADFLTLYRPDPASAPPLAAMPARALAPKKQKSPYALLPPFEQNETKKPAAICDPSRRELPRVARSDELHA